MDRLRPGIGQTAFKHRANVVPGDLGPSDRAALDEIAERMRGRCAALLTGAGLSTDSGIPDYRGPDAKPRQPLTYQEFVGDVQLRQRYWARNHLGWSFMHQAAPNVGHYAAAALANSNHLSGIITQNVDRLHQAAGATNVIDLHGRFDQVLCLRCETEYSRAFLAVVLNELNPGFLDAAQDVKAAPDADADMSDEALIASFKIAMCPLCGGMLKPDFVFFGENVPKARVKRSFDMLDAGDLLIVAGSSLTVMSGLRFAKRAAKEGKFLAIINRGTTRGDELADVKLDLGVSESLGYLARALDADSRNS